MYTFPDLAKLLFKRKLNYMYTDGKNTTLDISGVFHLRFAVNLYDYIEKNFKRKSNEAIKTLPVQFPPVTSRMYPWLQIQRNIPKTFSHLPLTHKFLNMTHSSMSGGGKRYSLQIIRSKLEC